MARVASQMLSNLLLRVAGRDKNRPFLPKARFCAALSSFETTMWSDEQRSTKNEGVIFRSSNTIVVGLGFCADHIARRKTIEPRADGITGNWRRSGWQHDRRLSRGLGRKLH